MSSLHMKRGREDQIKYNFTASGFAVDKDSSWLNAVPGAHAILDALTKVQGVTLSKHSSAASVALFRENGGLLFESDIFNPILNGLGEADLDNLSETQALNVLGDSIADKVAAVPFGGTIILTISSFPWWIIIITIIIQLAKALKESGKRLIIISARESDSHQESLNWLKGLEGLTNVDFITVLPIIGGGNVAVYTVKGGKILLGTLSKARDPESMGNASEEMIAKAETATDLPPGSLKSLQERMRSGTASNGCRDNHKVVATQLKKLFLLMPSLRTIQVNGLTLESFKKLQSECTPRKDVLPNPVGVITTENYLLLTYSGGISASMMFEEMKKKKHDSLRGLGSKDIQERLCIEIEAGRGHLSVCVLNSGVTTASPIKAEADSPFRDKRRYDYHLPPTAGGNTLPKHVSSVLNSLVPDTSTSANSVFIAIRGSNSDEAYMNECILGGVLGTQTGAENRRNEASQSNVIKIGTNFISPGKSEKDPLTLASKLASGELGVKTLAWCMSDQSSQRGAAYLIDRLMENLPEPYPTRDSVEVLTAKYAYSVFCQFNGQKVAKARAEFLLLDSDTKAAMRDATAAELLGERNALKITATGRFKKAAKKAAIHQGLGRSEARSTAVGAAIGMGWHVRRARGIPDYEEITPEALKASGTVIASEMGLASAAEYRSLVEGDAAGTLTPAQQEKFRLWHEARQASAAEYRSLVEGDAGGTLTPAEQEKFCLWSNSMIEPRRVIRELAAKAREKTNFKNLR